MSNNADEVSTSEDVELRNRITRCDVVGVSPGTQPVSSNNEHKVGNVASEEEKWSEPVEDDIGAAVFSVMAASTDSGNSKGSLSSPVEDNTTSVSHSNIAHKADVTREPAVHEHAAEPIVIEEPVQVVAHHTTFAAPPKESMKLAYVK